MSKLETQSPETPLLAALHKNALAVTLPTQQRALYWKTFAALQLELLGLGEYVEPNAMRLTVVFGGIPQRTVIYRRVDAGEFSRLSAKTPRHVENVARAKS